MKKSKIWLLAALLMILLASCGGKYVTVDVEWTVYDKNYIPATSGTSGHWGYSFAGDGGLVWIGGTSGSPAQYEFFLRRENEQGEIATKLENVSQEEYASYEVGDSYFTKEDVLVSKEASEG